MWDGVHAERASSCPTATYRAGRQARALAPDDRPAERRSRSTRRRRGSSCDQPKYPIISPDGDGHADVFRVPYALSEPAHAILPSRGAAGRVHERPEGDRRARSGTARLGSSSSSLRAGPVRARRSLRRTAQATTRGRSRSRSRRCGTSRSARTRVVVRPGGRFALRVSTDAPPVDWRLHGRSGRSRAGRCVCARRRQPGVYRLYVSVGEPLRAAARWWSHERRSSHRSRARSARSGWRLLHRRAPARPASRRPRRVGGRLRGARRLPRTARAPPSARGRGRARR